MLVLGIDVGGSGLKSALVDNSKAVIVSDVFTVSTKKLTPEEFGESVKKIVTHFNWNGIIGCGFPAVVTNGIVKTATNIDKKFINTDLVELIKKTTNCQSFVVNDADAAAMAEFKFGLCKDVKGLKLMITLGTGIGTAIYKTELIPNLEFGLITMKNGMIAEKYCAASIKTKENLSYETWANRLDEYLKEIDSLTNPDLIVLGGGISKDYEKFEKYMSLKNKIQTATFYNNTGIIGAGISINIIP